MIAIILSILAVASAAPRYDFHPHRPMGPPSFPRFHPPPRYPGAMSESEEGLLDVGRFWEDFAKEMHKLDDMIKELSKEFPTGNLNESVDGNEYKITITLPGFDEKDIVVKGREGMLMIQAVHKYQDGNEKSYLDLRTLPASVDMAGSWTYDKETLRIVFPLVKKTDVTEATVTDATAARENTVKQSREEMDSGETTSQDADVGLGLDVRGDREDVVSNMIPQNPVEATTYAVDLKNEVEFVPMKY